MGCGGNRGNLGIGQVRFVQVDGRAGIKIQLDRQLPGDQALQGQHGPQPLVDKLLEIFPIVGGSFLPAHYFELVRFDFDDDGNFRLFSLGVGTQNELLHGPYGHPPEQHRRSDGESLDGAFEVHEIKVGFLEELPRAEDHDTGRQQKYRDDNESADHHPVCLFCHL